VSDSPTRDLAAFEERLGYSFRRRELLETALCHASRANEDSELVSNERLEFLGDSVVGLVVAHRLYEAHSTWEEGDLTRALHALVDKRAHAALAEDLGLAEVIELGRTVRGSDADASGLRSILADAMEAVIGAMYLDGGEPPVGDLIERCFPAAFEAGATPPSRDPKTELQEACVAHFSAFPRYSLTSDTGVEGDESRFRMEVVLPDAGATTGRGVGRSKRSAQRMAAQAALEALLAEGLRDEESSG